MTGQRRVSVSTRAPRSLGSRMTLPGFCIASKYWRRDGHAPFPATAGCAATRKASRAGISARVRRRRDIVTSKERAVWLLRRDAAAGLEDLGEVLDGGVVDHHARAGLGAELLLERRRDGRRHLEEHLTELVEAGRVVVVRE